MRKHLKRAVLIVMGLIIAGAAALFGINAYVVGSVKPDIKKAEELTDFQADAVIVPGAYVHKDGRLSNILEDRVKRGVEVYKCGGASKLIMSGDHGRKSYDEVDAMKKYAVSLGVPSENIFMDHAGFSTYETLCRARDVFQAKRVIVVTQEYHLYRALYIAESLGMEARGVTSDQRTYPSKMKREFREILARNKDFLYCIAKPEPTYLGEAIPVSGNGNVTND